jgi:hypothetical protein
MSELEIYNRIKASAQTEIILDLILKNPNQENIKEITTVYFQVARNTIGAENHPNPHFRKSMQDIFDSVLLDIQQHFTDPEVLWDIIEISPDAHMDAISFLKEQGIKTK